MNTTLKLYANQLRQKDILVFMMGLEPHLKSVTEYFSSGIIDREPSSVVRAVRTRAKNCRRYQCELTLDNSESISISIRRENVFKNRKTVAR